MVLDEAVGQRLSDVFGICAALQTRLPVPARAHEWLRKPNRAPLFDGAAALARLLSGDIEDLKRVREYVDAAWAG